MRSSREGAIENKKGTKEGNRWTWATKCVYFGRASWTYGIAYGTKKVEVAIEIAKHFPITFIIIFTSFIGDGA
jgi:ABC-type dipeptide/oligopeptide/nickel transport system permease component